MADEKAPQAAPPSVSAGATATAADAASPGRATTCAQCGKRLLRKKQYYRNGRYHCNKRCWRAASLGMPSQTAA